MESKTWHAVYTRSRAEKKVTELMNRNGYTAYLPMVKTLRQWSDRKKKVEVPLISSYVFVHVSERDYYSILNTPGVVRYVMFEGKAAPIPEKQIRAMRIAVENDVDLELSAAPISPGEAVRVVSGPMKGVEGELIRNAQKHKLLIRINHTGYALLVKVSAGSVMKISR